MHQFLQLLVKTLVLYCVAAGLWYIFRNFFVKSSIDNIPGPKRDSWVWGNLKIVYALHGVPWHLSMPRKFGRAFKIHGILGDEQLYVTDPLALHHIVVKDQNVYEETSMFIIGNQLNFGKGLLGTLGDAHRKQRKIVNPVFSIAHMRNLTPIFYSTAHELCVALTAQFQDGQPKEVDMRPWVSKTALELIGRGGFGYSFDVFGKDTGNEYRKHVKDFTRIIFSFSTVQQFLPFFVKWGSPQFLRLLLSVTPWKKLHKARDIIDTMYLTSQKVYEERKKEVDEGLDGQDIMSVLVRANRALDEKERLTEEELVAQIKYIFIPMLVLR
jgi:cytochrome P450